MAQFRATIQGNRGAASRLGHKTTGLHVECNGWTAGVRIAAQYHKEYGDLFAVYATSGSNGGKQDQLIGHVDQKGNFTPASVGLYNEVMK